jgi:hypothetical protein
MDAASLTTHPSLIHLEELQLYQSLQSYDPWTGLLAPFDQIEDELGCCFIGTQLVVSIV